MNKIHYFFLGLLLAIGINVGIAQVIESNYLLDDYKDEKSPADYKYNATSTIYQTISDYDLVSIKEEYNNHTESIYYLQKIVDRLERIEKKL